MPKVKTVPVKEVEATKTKIKAGPPQLFWTTISHESYETIDQSFAPNEISIRERFRSQLFSKTNQRQGSLQFWKAAKKAEIIYLMDTNFGANEMKYLSLQLQDSKNLQKLKILCRSDAQDTERKKIFNHFKGKINIKDKAIDLRLFKRQSFPFLHDRFAVIDGELWHFGATVGGLHDSVTAFSRGWSAEDHKFLELFKLAWENSVHEKQ